MKVFCLSRIDKYLSSFMNLSPNSIRLEISWFVNLPATKNIDMGRYPFLVKSLRYLQQLNVVYALLNQFRFFMPHLIITPLYVLPEISPFTLCRTFSDSANVATSTNKKIFKVALTRSILLV